MAQENEEQTSENPVEETTEEETPIEEESSEEQETSEEPETVSKEEYDALKKKNEQLFARLKKTGETKKEQRSEVPELDPEEIATTMAAFEGLDKEERVRLIQESRLKKLSLSEARNDEDFQLWQDAHKRKVEKTRKKPGSTSPGSGRTEKSFREIADMSPEEHRAYDEQMMREVQTGI